MATLSSACDLPDIDWDSLDLRPRHNAAPTQQLPIIVPSEAGQRKLKIAQWGYIPPWSETRYPKISTINAKAEGLLASRLWGPLLKSPVPEQLGRCLVIADGFYEWKKGASGKQPMRLHLPDNEPFAFAGLYGTWLNRQTGEEVLSFAIVTCPPNRLLAKTHNRMAVILDAAGATGWLDARADPEQCVSLCVPCDDNLLVAEPVSPLVNSSKNDKPECVAAWEPARQATL